MLPDAVVALAEETVRFYTRNPTASALGAELALRTAAYMANKEEAHSRCRWGEGSRPGWYSGTERRKRSLVEHARSEANAGVGCSMCALLTKAVSPKTLSDATRANVAAKTALTCAWCVVSLR